MARMSGAHGYACIMDKRDTHQSLDVTPEIYRQEDHLERTWSTCHDDIL